MVTPLTTYGTNTASGTLATANTLVTSTGAGSINKTTLVGTSTGYGTFWSQGNAGAWPAAGSLPAFNGHGWLWDVTTLEGNLLFGGNFTPTFTLSFSSVSFVADLYVRIARYNGG